MPVFGWGPLQAGCQQRLSRRGEEPGPDADTEEDVEIHALRKQGWSISAIARHLGRDRKTVRAYLAGVREPGVRVSAEPDPFDRFEPYVRQRLADDRHLWATTLFDEVAALGYDRSYPTFTRKLRQRELRPRCEACEGVKGRATVDIDHPPGEEIQWDWAELGACPWDPGVEVFLLVGALSYSSQARGWLTYRTDQPQDTSTDVVYGRRT